MMAMASVTLPRGIRLHNPGCLERLGIDWRGLAPDQSVDPRLVVFTAPEWGIRALARTLMGYQHQEARRSIAALISRFRPPEEYDTTAYCRWVAASLDRQVADPISLDEPATLMGLVQAIIRRESGPLPDGRACWYSLPTVAKGLALAETRKFF